MVGLLTGRDPVEMLRRLRAADARLVVACPPPSPRAVPPPRWPRGPDAGRRRRGADVGAEAVATALAVAKPDDIVVVTGSLYVVGAARAALGPRR